MALLSIRQEENFFWHFALDPFTILKSFAVVTISSLEILPKGEAFSLRRSVSRLLFLRFAIRKVKTHQQLWHAGRKPPADHMESWKSRGVMPGYYFLDSFSLERVNAWCKLETIILKMKLRSSPILLKTVFCCLRLPRQDTLAGCNIIGI